MTIILSNFVPTGSFANPTTPVSFDITSDGDPIDLDTLDVWFEEGASPDASNAAVIDGVSQDGYAVSITATTVSGNPGYSVYIVPQQLMNSMTIKTLVRADTDPASGVTSFSQEFATATYAGRIMTSINPLLAQPSVDESVPPIGLTFGGRAFNVLFQLNDANEPTITNRIPVVNSTDNAVDTDIQFSVHDYGAEGINITTLYVYLDDTMVVSGGAFVYPYTGTITEEVIDDYAAFTVVITPASSYLYSQWVDVRVVVSDLVSDPSAVNTLDTTYQFRTEEYVDTGGPQGQPTQPPTGLGLDACIEFDWLDEPQGPGPVWDTLNVTLRRELTVECITSIRDDIAVVNGVAAPGYTVYANSITVGYQVGYHVWVCPEVPFNELETITVIISGEDESGSTGASSFSISTAEITPPTMLNFDPADGDTNVSPTASIYFEMHDSAGSGVDINNISINVDDGEAVIDGVVQSGFNLTIVNERIIDEFGLDFDGYEFTLTRDIAFTPARGIAVEIDGYDSYGNRATEVYSFTIAPHTEPPDITFHPANGETGLNRDQNVVVDFTDPFNVDKDTVDVWVNGEQAISDGVGVAPFDVYLENIPDGYRYLIDTEKDFAFSEVVTVRARASDVYSNSATATSSFTVFTDPSGPSITNVSPRDGQEEVSLGPTLAFTIRDGYDVALELTEVTVNGESALLNGLAQSGYTLVTSRISGGVMGVDPGDGYNVYLTRTEGFEYSQTVAVNIKAYDRSQNNETDSTFTWYTIDPLPPRFDVVPVDGTTDVALDTDIAFEVFDDGYGVDINTLNATLDDVPMVADGVVQTPTFEGTITTIVANEHYRVEINPRYLIRSDSVHTIKLSAEENTSDNEGSLTSQFRTTDPLENPETLYIGGSNGVLSIATGQIDGYSEPTYLFGSYHVNDLSVLILNEINRLAVATQNNGAFVYSTNYPWPTLFYSSGDEIVKVHISTAHNGTLYLANRTQKRVDVYYDILADDAGRDTPDVYYAAVDESIGFDGYAVEGILDGYFTDMVVTENTSSVTDGSSTIFLATPYGVFKVDTDESVTGNTEINGVVTSYGVADSDATYNVLAGNHNKVEAIDVNTRLNHLYVATRGEEEGDVNALTYIDLSTNTRSGVLLEAELIHRLINDINFQD